MPTFLANLDLSGSEIQNVRAQSLGTAPGSPGAGQFYYDSALGVLRYRNASAWVDLPALGSLATLSTVTSSEITNGTIVNIDISAGAAIDLSKLAADPLARAGHTGSQLASTISDFNTAVRLNRLDQMTTPTASVSMGSQLLTSVATPVSSTDGANKAYVDSVAVGLDVKPSVRAAFDAITVASPGADIDDVSMVAGDRVLRMVNDAADGIYIWNGAAVPMTRAPDADTSAEVTSGMFVFCEEGTVNADKGFVLSTNNPITLGTTSLTFTQFSGGGGGSVTGTTNRIDVTGSQVDIAATYVGQSSLTTLGTITAGTWTGTAIAVANGGTGSTTAAGAKTALAFMGRYATSFGNGALTTFTITHSLGSNDVTAEVYDTATMATVYCNITRASTNSLTVDGFTTPPTTNQLRVVVVG